MVKSTARNKDMPTFLRVGRFLLCPWGGSLPVFFDTTRVYERKSGHIHEMMTHFQNRKVDIHRMMHICKFSKF